MFVWWLTAELWGTQASERSERENPDEIASATPRNDKAFYF